MEYKQVLEKINKFAKQFVFFEFSIYSYSRKEMIIAGSDNSIYYHNLEIHLILPFHISSKTDWRADLAKTVVMEPERDEWVKYNMENRIEVGNRTIKFVDDDGLFFYFSFAEIDVVEKLVKYYT